MTGFLTTQVKDYARCAGADLIGICHTNGLVKYPEKGEKTSSFNTAIIVGVKHSDTAFKLKNIRALQYDTYCTYQELNHITFNLVRFLEKREFDATAISPYIPVEMSRETRGLLGDVSHRLLAAEAGLGCIGFSRLLITPDFGPRVRLASILTTAPLEPDEQFRDNLCEGCERGCAKACPVNAITADGVDIKKCSRENMKYGLPGLINLLDQLSSSTNIPTDLEIH